MDNLIERAVEDLLNCKYAIALTGAGISTESGIPDFRGPDGVWTRDPEAEKRAYEAYQKFLDNPVQHWKDSMNTSGAFGNLSEIKPNRGHYALAEMEQKGILKWTITQNIDNLHERAGSKNVLNYHGNAFILRCIYCNTRYGREEYDLDKLYKEDKLPPLCSCGQPLKSDVVFFNEAIPEDVAGQSLEEAFRCDLMLICGTSATVYPFASLPVTARGRVITKEKEPGYSGVTIIEVNAEPTALTRQNISDYLIQGKTGEILPRILDGIRGRG